MKRKKAMQELIEEINKMKDEYFFRFYKWWMENEDSTNVPWYEELEG